MARGKFRIEEGFEIQETNGTTKVCFLQDAGAPLGTSGSTDDAPIGSLYLRNDGEGELYHKVTSTSSASDWEPFADKSVYDALGISFDDEDMGVYTGNILTDNTGQSTLNQELSDAIEAIAGGSSSDDNVPAATPTVVNTCLVDNCDGVEYEVVVFETADETKKEMFKITAIHDGTSTTDATDGNQDESVHTKLKINDISGLTFQTKVEGTGVSQTMGLEISATAAVTVKTRRTDIVL